MSRKVLVCGGRDYLGDVTCLGELRQLFTIDLLIAGGAKGADKRAADWARARGIHVAEVQALWDFYGKAAGFKRNSAMRILGPDYCVAFPGGKGTEMMVKLCEDNQILVWRPYG